ncbi:MAG: hypothetical protein KA242_02405 [Chitinophagales bacterium]|nr:hypothetical protein [Chitinophagales bacterium]
MMKLLKHPVLLLRGLVALLYVVLGGFLCVNTYYLYFVSRNYRIALAILVLAYGLFRFYRFVQEFKALQHDEA